MYLADAVSNCIEALFLFLNVSVPGTMTGKIEHETPELVTWSGIFKIARFVPDSPLLKGNPAESRTLWFP